MKILVISDIHGNLEALESILEQINNTIPNIWFLGDVAGYGPDPHICLKILREKKALMISGNHDWAVCGKLDTNNFNYQARAGVELHKRILTEEDLDFLASLPPKIEYNSVTLSHGHPSQPVWGYVLDSIDASDVFSVVNTQLTLIGHTHIPGIWMQAPHSGAREIPFQYGEAVHYGQIPHIVNPGSVGQTRDNDPAARYMILDTDQKTITIERCLWDSKTTQKKMRKHGLPEELIQRMAPPMPW